MIRTALSAGACAQAWAALAAVLALLATQTPTQAGLIVTAGAATAVAGTNDNYFDVTLRNDGPDAASVGAFSFGLKVDAGAPITFDRATTETAAIYVFNDNSFVFNQLGTNVISTTPPGRSVTAADGADVFTSPPFAPVQAGQTVGLGRVYFNVSAGAAANVYTVEFVTENDTTGVANADDPNANLFEVTKINGSITVTASAVPEPAVLVMAGLGWPAALLMRRLGRRVG